MSVVTAGLVACDHAKEHAALKESKEKSLELDSTLSRLAEEGAAVNSDLRSLGFDGDKMEKSLAETAKQTAKGEADKKRLEGVVAGLTAEVGRIEGERAAYKAKYLKP